MTRIFLTILTIFCLGYDLKSQKRDIGITEDDNLSLTKVKSSQEFKTKYLCFSSGWSFNATHTKSLNNFFEPISMVNSGFFPSLMYEFGIKKRLFSEIGFDINKQSISISRPIIDDERWTSSTSFLRKHRSNNFNFGFGYRVTNKKDFNFFNIHGGFYLGLSNKSVSDMNQFIGGNATYFIFEERNNLIYHYTRTLEKYSRFSFGCYIGVSKEIRLSKDILFFVKYSHRFGFIPQFSGTYDVYFDDANLDFRSKFLSRGGGYYFSGGLKFLLFKKQFTSNEN